MSGPLVELAVAAGARREARGALAALARGRRPHAERVLASQRRDHPRTDRLVGRPPVAPDAARPEGGERAPAPLGFLARLARAPHPAPPALPPAPRPRRAPARAARPR